MDLGRLSLNRMRATRLCAAAAAAALALTACSAAQPDDGPAAAPPPPTAAPAAPMTTPDPPPSFGVSFPTTQPPQQATAQQWTATGADIALVSDGVWAGTVAVDVRPETGDAASSQVRVRLPVRGMAEVCDLDADSWTAQITPRDHPHRPQRTFAAHLADITIDHISGGHTLITGHYTLTSGDDSAAMTLAASAITDHDCRQDGDPDELITAEPEPEPEPASGPDPDDDAEAPDDAEAEDDGGHEHDDDGYEPDDDGHEHDPDSETQIPEESEGHTARIVDVGDGAMPAEPGGVPRKPAWFVNGPDWVITPTVQAFSDWCHQPLYEPLPYDHSHVPGHRDALIHSCVYALHSMAAPSDPRVAVPGDCLLAVTQETFLRVRRRVGWPIVWADRTSPLPAHIGPDRNSVDKPYPHWADCPSKLWPGPYMPARDHPDAERACHWAGSVVAELDPEQTWAVDQGEASGTSIGWGTTADGDGSCVTNLWDPRSGRCGFASDRFASILFRAGELPKFMEWVNCE